MENLKEMNETTEVLREETFPVGVEDTIIDVEATDAVEEVLEETAEAVEEEKQPNWMSFLIGVRGDSVYDVKTNVDPCMVTDYIEACAGIEMNVVVQLLKTVGMAGVENFFKMKEILVLNSVRLMRENLESVDISPEQYDELRAFFQIDKIESILEQRKQELVQAQPQEEAVEEKYEIEME